MIFKKGPSNHPSPPPPHTTYIHETFGTMGRLFPAGQIFLGVIRWIRSSFRFESTLDIVVYKVFRIFVQTADITISEQQ